jgi:mycofactocin system glycosyltransferase
VIRLSAAGSTLLGRWLAQAGNPGGDQALALRERLLHAGIVHPVIDPTLQGPNEELTAAFVVPVYNDVAGLRALLAQLRVAHPTAPVVVVDDASTDDVGIAAVAHDHHAELLVQAVNSGPAAARNAGWRHLLTSSAAPGVVVFVDADVVLDTAAVPTLLAHFEDSKVAVVAPRVRAQTGSEVLARYEADNSPLDLGPDPAVVVPGTRISYVPSAAIAVRSSVLDEVDGFDETMRYGEDVDLVWRLIDGGHLVRYEPAAIAWHRNRPSIQAFLRQRESYGSSAASLARNHGAKVSPLQLPASVLATTALAAVGGSRVKAAAVLAAAASTVPLRRRLENTVDEPTTEAARLTALSYGYALHGLAAAATRSWLPVLLPFRRTRQALAAAFIVPAALDWFRSRPALDPPRFLALRVADHGAYCAGVWRGVWRNRSATALLPHVRTPWNERTND